MYKANVLLQQNGIIVNYKQAPLLQFTLIVTQLLLKDTAKSNQLWTVR